MKNINTLKEENKALKEQMKIKKDENEAKIASLTAKLESSVTEMNEKVDNINRDITINIYQTLRDIKFFYLFISDSLISRSINPAID